MEDVKGIVLLELFKGVISSADFLLTGNGAFLIFYA
jgi:hypothetical protein